VWREAAGCLSNDRVQEAAKSMRLPWTRTDAGLSPIERTLNEIGYFRQGVVGRPPPASEEAIAAAERAVGAPFPPTMRAFLKQCNGLQVPDLLVWGVTPVTHRDGSSLPDLVQETRELRTRPTTPERLIAVAHKTTGDDLVLLPAEAQGREEYPVAQLDHETGEVMFILASTFERFLWFAIDDAKRHNRPDGEWNERDTSGPWIHDRRWMLKQDPDLARWISV
jgi:hypothetical protein